MIEFDVDILRDVAEQAGARRSHLLELCEIESDYTFATPLEVSAILNVALDMGLVLLPEMQIVTAEGERLELANARKEAYAAGFGDGKTAAPQEDAIDYQEPPDPREAPLSSDDELDPRYDTAPTNGHRFPHAAPEPAMPLVPRKGGEA